LASSLNVSRHVLHIPSFQLSRKTRFDWTKRARNLAQLRHPDDTFAIPRPVFPRANNTSWKN
jgi:hypothetical protein